MVKTLCFALTFLSLGVSGLGGASASTLTLGAPIDNGSCTKQGSGGDRSCDRDADINNRSDSLAYMSIRAHAAADAAQDPFDTYRAKATNNVRYVFPYTVTRTVTVEERDGALVQIIPKQTLQFKFDYDFRVIVRNEVGSGNEVATIDQTSIEIGGVTYSFGQESVSNSSTLAQDRLEGSRTYDLDLPVGKTVGEVSVSADIPTDFLLWDDLNAPTVDYATEGTFEQSYTDVFVVGFRMVADSYDRVGFGGNGGEAFVCGGQAAGISNFSLDDLASPGFATCDREFYVPDCDLDDLNPDIDNPLNCDPFDFSRDPTGFFGTVVLSESGTIARPFTTAAVPLPAAGWMLLAGLGLMLRMSLRRSVV